MKGRQLRTHFGLFEYQLARVWDKRTGHPLSLLSQWLDIPRYPCQTAEAGQDANGLVCHLSYRQRVQEVEGIVGASMSKSSLHRQIQEFGANGCQWPQLK